MLLKLNGTLRALDKRLRYHRFGLKLFWRPQCPQIRVFEECMDAPFHGSSINTVGSRFRLRRPEISPFWFELALADSGASYKGLWGVYRCAFSWQFYKHYRQSCSTSAAGDIAVLVWTSFGGLRGLWSGRGRCLWMCFFMAILMKLSAAASEPGGLRYCCLLMAASLFLPQVRRFAQRTDLCCHTSLSPVSLTPAWQRTQKVVN